MVGIDEVLRILKDVPASKFEPGHIQKRLGGVVVDGASLTRFLHFRPGHYTRNLIHRDETFELLALCWDGNARSPVHNHSGQDCWFLVQEGEFCVDGYRILEGGLEPGRAALEHVETTHRVGAGALDHRGPQNDIHRVKVSRGNTRAVSLHVYARPFDECLIYDVERAKCQRQRLRYDTIDGRPAAS